MNNQELNLIKNRWEKMIGDICKTRKIEIPEAEKIFKDTYEALYVFHKDELVPKEILNIIMNMENYLYILSLVTLRDETSEEAYFEYNAFYNITSAIKEGFIEGRYKAVFPKLKVEDSEHNDRVLDLDSNFLEDFIYS